MTGRIEVTRSGGFAGITRRAVVEDPDEEAGRRWTSLVRQAEDVAEPNVRDGFTWSIRVALVQVEAVEVVLTDAALAGPLRELAETALREGRGDGAGRAT